MKILKEVIYYCFKKIYNILYMTDYYSKYLKYKNKYLDLKNNQTGGGDDKIKLILYKSETCGHCKNFVPVWNTLQQNKSFQKKYDFITYESTKNPDKFDGIDGVPTLKIVDGSNERVYDGDRSLEDLTNLLNSLEKL